MPPPVAVIVRVEVWAAAVSLSVLVPAPGGAMLVGVKLAVTPLGSPLIENATAAPKPFTRAVVKLMEADPPGAMLALVEFGVTVKLGAGTVKLKGRVAANPPPVALTVSV
jgi:hypothetical protein